MDPDKVITVPNWLQTLATNLRQVIDSLVLKITIASLISSFVKSIWGEALRWGTSPHLVPVPHPSERPQLSPMATS